MMSRGVVVSSLMLAFSAMFMEMLDARNIQPLNCPANMEEGCSPCWGGTCESLSSPVILKCKDQCNRGCVCKKGYYVQNNECVPASQCKVQCPANMEFNPCVRKVVTCLTINGSAVDYDECKPRCQCVGGYIFSGQKPQDCIEMHQCSKPENTK
ncbi:zonadhesin-like [Phyllobates terribilis]|uniref:zonadhesin-like n=1 Tax=Phyllobates terribilis TaxID=111132 RepID=UPI003CCB1151